MTGEKLLQNRRGFRKLINLHRPRRVCSASDACV
jgi:hypothetical protein